MNCKVLRQSQLSLKDMSNIWTSRSSPPSAHAQLNTEGEHRVESNLDNKYGQRKQIMELYDISNNVPKIEVFVIGREESFPCCY